MYYTHQLSMSILRPNWQILLPLECFVFFSGGWGSLTPIKNIQQNRRGGEGRERKEREGKERWGRKGGVREGRRGEGRGGEGRRGEGR